ncbi:hypothetical protein C6P46_003863 [Rhodotorula mucilaginosa]|uniref:Uncharacterized protein n=1 Tax=Rhodotorula mucilaginosa TaxID=5537 RepID=A0A9P6W109_RHOMI|nr:hypothetical protein C6P46_003863 [Rhodotorula mucilaginosa]
MSPSLLRRVFKKRTPEDKLTTMLVELEKAFPCGGPAIVQALVAEHPEDWTTCFIRVMNKVLKQLILQKELPNVELEDHKDELQLLQFKALRDQLDRVQKKRLWESSFKQDTPAARAATDEVQTMPRQAAGTGKTAKNMLQDARLYWIRSRGTLNAKKPGFMWQKWPNPAWALWNRKIGLLTVTMTATSN